MTEQHYCRKTEQVLSEKQTLSWTYFDFANIPHSRGCAWESVTQCCHGHLWRIHLFARGSATSSSDKAFVAVFLVCLSIKGEEELKTTAEVRLKSTDVSHKFSAHVFDFHRNSFGWPDFVSRDDILDPSNDFLVDGNLEIDVILQVYQDKKRVITGRNRLRTDMIKMLDSAIHTGDTKFEIGREQFSAHLAILRARAPGLAALAEEFPSNTTIPIQGDTTPLAFRALLNYIYGDSVPVAEEFQRTAIDLLNAADRFGCVGLKLEAEAVVILTGINVETAADLILLGDAKKCALLKEAAIDFFVENCAAVMNTTGWIKVSESAELLNEVLKAVVTKNTARPANSSDENDYDQMQVSTLHEKLEEKGLDIDGSREMLISRLKEAENDYQSQSPNNG